ncbi:hypothetical protein E2C01_076274 [Portunus trituberculatus]|uniref:Uncharacterized protein n=1 Tax=Portunus trituberculatus TaxID=210409 RepID=A0A5B7II50_PORTR|nr:hypothetical protein [Portunus trituberculatus]
MTTEYLLTHSPATRCLYLVPRAYVLTPLKTAGRDTNASLRVATPEWTNAREMQPNLPRFSQNNNPLFYSHGLPSSKPTTQTGGHNSQTND